MMTKLDPETNILRTTIAGFAAAAGGADSIAVLPHTVAHGLPDAFARRLARNTQLVLADESNLAFVADPACGSGAVESLTEKLCEAAWKEFQALEHDGGILQSLVDGKFQARIIAARNARTENTVPANAPSWVRRSSLQGKNGRSPCLMHPTCLCRRMASFIANR